MSKNDSEEVQKSKITKARAKRASKRSAKRGIINTFKTNIIHNLPVGLDNVPLRVGAQFAKTFSFSGRNYVQAVEIVNVMYKSEENGEYFQAREDIPEGVEVLEIPVTSAKTAVRL
jgi:hypothetical protein